MQRYDRSLEIDAAPSAVWSVLGDFMRIDEFAPLVQRVEALTHGENGVGSRRRCYFDNGTSVVEEVVEWDAYQGYRVSLDEMAAMPLHEASAKVSVEALPGERSKVNWSMVYRVKYGPFGWLLGQTMMRIMLRKVFDGNLQGLAAQVRVYQTATV